MEDLILAKAIAEKVREKGGRTYFVGGYVRDVLMGKDPEDISDIDIEVHGITHDALEEILDIFGSRIETGLSFGIYGIAGHGLDIALPRYEENTGSGHRDFKIYTDPFAGTYSSAKRRDFTINALMQDALTGEITDHFGGLRDLSGHILRHVNDKTFREDPLRVLRGARFLSGFSFKAAPETVEICRNTDLSGLAKERVFGELVKTFKECEKPSLFFEFLRETGNLDVWFPEVASLAGIPQSPIFHTEGDAWAHTMLVLDEAKRLSFEAQEPVGLMLSALCHDLGKAVATEYESGLYHAKGHETAGLPIADRFLHRLTADKALIRYVLNMVEHHMKPNMYARDLSSVNSTCKMFHASVSPSDLILLSYCDCVSSHSICSSGEYDPEEIKTTADANMRFLKERLEIYKERADAPGVTGKDLIDAGYAPGKDFTAILKYCEDQKLCGIPKERILRSVKSEFPVNS